jgi:flagellar protein FliL
MLIPMSGRTTSAKPESADASAAEPEAPATGKNKLGKKKLILFAAPVLLIGVVAGLWFTGILPGLLGMRHGQQTQDAAKPAVPIFVDLPDMIANLASPANKTSYIKLQARLEISRQEDADKVKQEMPRLQDMLQTYLREMRPEELRGSAGIYRLREELLGRANVVLAPIRVNDVLFTQLLIQ